ncbi:MAG: hypothetical protein Ta2D_13660 [Rickettsiales bacterium]|nr:MAG: hypothetical protein Ta2D_13660 [Rickettsiales bacterium]
MYKDYANSGGHSSNYCSYNEVLPNTITSLCTDGHHAYHRVYNAYKDNIKHHIVSKSQTCLVECFN